MKNPSLPNARPYRVVQPTTLLPFIEQQLSGISRSRAKAILAGGGVSVNHKITTQFDLPLRPGMLVEISSRKPRAEIKSKFVRLVYEDPYIVVIEKSVGILSMASTHHQFCVKTILDDYFRRSHQRCTAHVVHRLDRETSGLLVYAKDLKAEQILEHNWHDIVTDRRYVALLHGRMEEERGTVASWLKDNKAYFTYSSPTDNGGKYAVTHFRTLRAADDYSLVELKLETGRKNQIRVHMLDLGHPVVGDTKYRLPEHEHAPARRLCLHAFRLCFYHPITGEHLEFETPLPKW